MSSCCESGHSHTHEHEHDDLDLMNDPTLASCCEKDERAYRKAMELKRVLTAQDPTSQNVRVRQQIVQEPPKEVAITTSAATQAANAAALADRLREIAVAQEDSDDDSDFELDDDLDEVFAARRQELAAQFEQALKNAADGYGILLETDLKSLLDELKSSPQVPRVALVRSSRLDEGEVREMLKEMLTVAKRYVGTKFYSIVTNSSRDDDAIRQLRLSSAHNLVAFRVGQRVDATPIQEKDFQASASILWEARLIPWLTMCNVLETSRQDTQRQPATQRSVEKSSSADEEPVFDCGKEGCRIRFAYEHEHVGASQESKNAISAWRQD
ncbi:hypothetical protein Poli38472_008136 [Pythium oligandrum]|uniref:Uncharacterized protein n=1 Tax=Pythium oligandrum TaxID=41045 RepID=A0A8K1CLY7_PYTOL|nr:hypothetical protein Poli38472_008136 [Pythium oligandrum]|eukprot:TMW65494.1 hypothetical protein Poli38472_008136 [Pythium oligandrum]